MLLSGASARMCSYGGDAPVKARKDYGAYADLLERARLALGTKTEAETVAAALRRVVEGEEIVQALVEGRGAFPDWSDPYHEA